MNCALKRGEYFWVDIVRDGTALYELPKHELPRRRPPRRPTYDMAAACFRNWTPKLGSATKLASFAFAELEPKDTAFLPQDTEPAYVRLLLVRTLHLPRFHNLRFLRSLAQDNEPQLMEAWRRATKLERRRFELLKRAQVGA